MKTTTPPRGRRTAEQWRQLVSWQGESGQSQVDFCRAHKISLSTFQYWKKRLGEGVGTESTAMASWIELPALPDTADGGWDIELELGGGVCLRLRRR